MIKEFRIMLHRGKEFVSDLCTLVEKQRLPGMGIII